MLSESKRGDPVIVVYFYNRSFIIPVSPRHIHFPHSHETPTDFVTIRPCYCSIGTVLRARPSLGKFGSYPREVPLKPQYTDVIISQDELQAAITEEKLMSHAQALEDIAYSTPERNRVMGSPGHRGTLDYVLGKLSDLGDYFNVEVQEFPVVYWTGSGKLNVEDSTLEEVNAFRYSPAGSVTGELVHVLNNGCNVVSTSRSDKSQRQVLLLINTQRQLTIRPKSMVKSLLSTAAKISTFPVA